MLVSVSELQVQFQVHWQDYEALHLGRLIVIASANFYLRRGCPPIRIVKVIFKKLWGDIGLKFTARGVVYILRVL